jgi:hypothetical protein
MHQWHRVVARPGANGADISTGSCHDPVPELFLHRVIKRTGTKCLRMSTGGKNHPVPMSSRVWIFPSAGRPLSLASLCPSHFSFLLSFLLLQHGGLQELQQRRPDPARAAGAGSAPLVLRAGICGRPPPRPPLPFLASPGCTEVQDELCHGRG